MDREQASNDIRSPSAHDTSFETVKMVDASFDENIITNNGNNPNGNTNSSGGSNRNNYDNSNVSNKPKKTELTQMQQLQSVILFIFPRGDRVSWDKFIAFSLNILLPSIIYIIFFTKMGYGVVTFYYISDRFEGYSNQFAVYLAAFTFMIFLLDVVYWETKVGKLLKQACLTISVLGICLLVLSVAGDYPYGPISLFCVVTPMWLLFIKVVFYTDIPTVYYVRWLSFPFFFVNVCVGISWLVWTFLRDENEWNENNQLIDAMHSGCDVKLDDFPSCRAEPGSDRLCFNITGSPPKVEYPPGCDMSCKEVYGDCLNTFIIWVGPLLVSLSLFFFSFFCTFVRVPPHESDVAVTDTGAGLNDGTPPEAPRSTTEEETTTEEEETTDADMTNFFKLWILLLFLIWITASYAGVGQGLTSALFALTFAGFVGSIIFLTVVLTKAEQKQQFRELMKKMTVKFGPYLDWVRALIVFCFAPLGILYVGMSFLIQCVRRTGIVRCSKKSLIKRERDSNGSSHDDDIHQAHWVTKDTLKKILLFQSWDRVTVYTYAVCWGIMFMTLQVIITKFMALLFSWVIEITDGMGIPAVTAIMVAFGLVLFLLPPVPGAPIYLTLGIVLIAVGEETLTIPGCILYGVAVSLAIKILACALQQKLIGERLSSSVYTRQLVGINSNLVRAMKLVLAEPGIKVAKVCILVGGPDWPTSVLCGIMNLDLIPILVGTLPVILLILPTTLSGSFTYMSNMKKEVGELEETSFLQERFPWAGTTATVTITIAASVQFGSFLLACFYLEQIMATRMDEIEAMPIDEEVLEADKKAEATNKAYSEVTQWKVLPLWSKITITFSVVCMISSCYIVQLFQSKCFVPFELTDTIDEKLDGDWKNIVLPIGQIVVALFILSCISLGVFLIWAKSKAKKIVAASSHNSSNDPVVHVESSVEYRANECEGHDNIEARVVVKSTGS